MSNIFSGWRCPSCGHTYNPCVKECPSCGPEVVVRADEPKKMPELEKKVIKPLTRK